MDRPPRRPNVWSRLRNAGFFRVLVVYLAASWVVIEVTSTLQEVLGLPEWVAPVAFVLLLVGLVVIAATAWVQSHPLRQTREETGEVPDAWEVELGEIGEAIRQGRLPHLTWARAVVGGLVVFSLLFGAAGLYVLLDDRGAVGPRSLVAADAPSPGVAVLPFNVSAPELDLWREGMVDMLSRDLDGVGGLRGIDSRTLLARWAESVPADAPADLETMLAVARAADARWALVGSIVGGGRMIRLDADIYDVDTRRKLGTAQAEGAPSEIMDAVDRLAVEVARTLLGGDAAAIPVQHLAGLTTSSLEALEAYLEGEALYRRAEFQDAAASFREALAADSTFALAWTRLHNALGWTDVGSDAYVEAGAKAMRYADRLPEREAVLIRALHGLTTGTLDELPALESAARRYPDDPELWAELAEYYYHYGGQVTSSVDSARMIGERAIELDPSFGPYYIHPVDLAIMAGDSANAARLLEAQRRASPGSDFHAASALAFDLAFGDPASRDSAWAEVERRPTDRRLLWAAVPLLGLSHSAVREEYMRRVLPRDDAFDHDLRWTLADRGKIQAMDAVDRAPGPLDYGMTVPAAIMGMASVGVEIPDDMLDRWLPDDDPAPTPLQVMARAALAVDRDAPTALRAALTEMARRADAAVAVDDSLEARRWRGLEAAVDGYRAWRAGDTDAADEAFDRARPAVTGWLGASSAEWFVPAATLRWWQARLDDERDRPADALHHFESLIIGPPFIRVLALYRQAALHERLGQPEEARRDYALFARVWEEADPQLQPLVQEANRRLEALTGEGR